MKKYLFALAFVAVATAGSLAWLPLRNDYPGVPDTLFFAAVTAAALYSNLRASLAALLASTLILGFFILPMYPGSTPMAALAVRTTMFFVGASLVCLLAHRSRLAKEREARSEKMFSDFIRSAPFGISLHRPDTTYLEINPRLAEWNGVPQDLHRGKTPSQVFPGIVSEAELKLSQVAETGQTLSFDTQGDPTDGKRERHWRVTYFPVRDQDGKIEAVGAAVVDTTEERKTQAALRESEARYRLLTESIPQYVWTTDAQGRVDYCNRHFLEWCGLTLEEVQAGRGIESVHPDDRDELMASLLKSQQTGEPFEHEYRAKRATDGQYRWQFAHSELFTGADGEQRWLGVAVDVTSRKRTELQLRDAHEQLSAILGSISESFIVLDREWRFVFANDRVLALTGKTWDELKGKVMWDMYPEAAQTSFKPGYEKVMREGVPYTFEVSYPQPDGSTAHYQVHAYPASSGLSALVSDVTARKKIENELAESRRLLHMVLDTARVGTWIFDFDSEEVVDLGNTARLLGLDRLASREDFLRALHPGDRPAVDQAMTAAKREGRYEVEYRVILPDGSIARMHGIGSMLHEDHPAHRRIAGVLLDVTDRTRGEEARLRLAAIVDSSDDAIISKDLSGTITSWNAAATRLFGYTAGEMIGRSILTLIPPELHAEEPRILAALGRGEKIDHYETERVHKNGQRLMVSLSISPIREANGDVIGASKIVRDISERMRMQEAIIQSEKLAATGRMAAAIAHEINNPLEAVTNLAYLLSTDPSLNDTAKKYTEMLLDEIGRASHVAKQSLGFFRDSSKPSAFDVCELLDSVLQLNRPLIDRKRIEVTRDYRCAVLTYGSSAELRQVFANLLRNAIEAIDENGAIQLRVRADGAGMQRILIADNGHGIPAATRARLFEPFVTSKGAAGNGLGLWVSGGIIRKHGGSIRVRTRTAPGRSGTVFLISLPIAPPPVSNERDSLLQEDVLN